MSSSSWFDRISLEWFIVNNEGSQVITTKNNFINCIEDHFVLANRKDT